MPTNSVPMTDHLVAMSAAGARNGLRPATDDAELRSLLSTCTPELARDAFLRFTASNRSVPAEPAPARAPGLWGWCKRHKILAVICAFFGWVFATAITAGNAGFGLLLFAAICGAIFWYQGRRGRTPTKRPSTVPATNPWPFGAERTSSHGELAGESTLLRPEAELVGIAVLIVETIKASPVVRSTVINTGDLLAQVDQSLSTISHQCYRVWWVRSTIEYPESDSDVGRALAAAIDQRLVRVQENWRELLDHVAQLAELAANFDSYAKVLRDYERHQRLMADSTVGGPSAADPRWDHLEGMQANLSAQIGFINDTARRVSSADLG
ncbi:hypothetical protein ACWDTI_04965 [Gordonia sp. NPDC003424]